MPRQNGQGSASSRWRWRRSAPPPSCGTRRRVPRWCRPWSGRTRVSWTSWTSWRLNGMPACGTVWAAPWACDRSIFGRRAICATRRKWRKPGAKSAWHSAPWTAGCCGISRNGGRSSPRRPTPRRPGPMCWRTTAITWNGRRRWTSRSSFCPHCARTRTISGGRGPTCWASRCRSWHRRATSMPAPSAWAAWNAGRGCAYTAPEALWT
ncbi:hypothetical protein D3C71_1451860 [compost metagenome]